MKFSTANLLSFSLVASASARSMLRLNKQDSKTSGSILGAEVVRKGTHESRALEGDRVTKAPEEDICTILSKAWYTGCNPSSDNPVCEIWFDSEEDACLYFEALGINSPNLYSPYSDCKWSEKAQMCVTKADDSSFVSPTDVPTASPTDAPSDKPTVLVVTDAPTSFPTSLPTEFPTQGCVDSTEIVFKKKKCNFVKGKTLKKIRKKCKKKRKGVKVFDACPLSCGKKAGLGRCDYLYQSSD